MPRAVPQTSKIILEPHQIIVRPLVTEKGMHRSTRNNAYAFEVHNLATKTDVRRAVDELFNVNVLARSHADPQGQAAPHSFPRRNDRQLEKGHRHVGQRTQDRFLLGENRGRQVRASDSF